jgi:hypothetical protein
MTLPGRQGMPIPLMHPGHFLQNKGFTVNGAARTTRTPEVSLRPAVPETLMADTTSFMKAVKKPNISVNTAACHTVHCAI